jgi:uncharacterized cupredoxin-like copper-binding protein
MRQNIYHDVVFVFAMLVVLGLSLAACNSNSTGADPNAPNVTVTLTSFKFEPATINATAGQKINLTLKNTDALEHTWVIPNANLKIRVPGKQTLTQTITVPAMPGIYAIDCDVPGHKDAGMVGQLVVK